MILVYGRADDPPTRHTLDCLQEHDGPVVFIEQRALAYEDLSIDITPAGLGGALFSGGRKVPLAEVTSVYARPLEPSVQGLEAGAQQHVAHLHGLLVEWLDNAAALVVNRPRAMQGNASKPHQLQIIGAAGFSVPATLVTSDAAEALTFWHTHGRVIYKSISGVRSIVRELDAEAAERLPQLSCLPVQFQEYIAGVDVRVHVVGRECYAATIESDGIDYRYAHHHGAEPRLQSMTLPEEIAARCVTLAQAMELPLAGIDLRLNPEGEYVCFEVNPMPAYTYFETHTDLPIGDALARLLISPELNGEVPHGAGYRKSGTNSGSNPVNPSPSIPARL